MAEKTPQELMQIDLTPPPTGLDGPGRRLRGAAGNLELPRRRPRTSSTWACPTRASGRPTDEDWKLPENWKQIILDGLQGAAREVPLASRSSWTSACAAAPAPTSATSSSARGDPKNMPVLRAELLRSIYRNDFTTAGQDPRRAGRRPRAHRGRAQGVVLLLLPVHRVPALLGLLPLRHRHRRDHHDGPRAAEPRRAQHQLGHRAGGQLLPHRQPPRHPAPRLQGQRRVPRARTSRRSPGIKVDPPINKKGAEILFVIPSADYFADPGIYTFMGYLLLFHEIGLDYTLSTYASEGGNFGLFTSPRDDQAAQRQDLRRGQAARRQVDPRRRVRPHVAGAAPVHGHHERPGRLPRGAASRRSPGTRLRERRARRRWSTSASSPPT